MQTQLVQLTFDKVMQTKSYTVIILGGNNKRFAIYTDPSVGRSIQMFLTESERQRPLTHDLMDMTLEGFGITVKQVVINQVEDTVYYARLFLEQQREDILHIVEIDARPSDCITLALMNSAPVYCTQEVLDKVVPIEE